ncbi:MAG: hypothetical protein WBJ13_05455 [Sedimentibacter sp.]
MNQEDKDYIDKKVGYIKRTLKTLKHYDSPTKLVDEIDKWLIELSYFHNTVVKDGQNPSDVIYNLPKSKRPKEGQIAYINLRRGYPKETYDDHWCYILKDFGTKYIVIPSTSIKEHSNKCNDLYEMDIKDCTPNGISRLQFTDVRSIDAMRICLSLNPNYYDVITSKNDILKKFYEIVLDKR